VTPGILSTARLRLRPPVPGDGRDIVAGLDDLAVSKWLTVVPHPYTLDDAHWFIGECAAGRDRSLAITRRNEDRVLGMIGGQDSFGYWLSRDAWGQGLMAEAARAMVGHLFRAHGAQVLHSEYFLGNTRSAAVLTGLGFEETGQREVTCRATGQIMRAQQMVLARGRWVDPSPRR
jgi:RimJ/RimL family protein N-acetyltransferase